jgi:arsenate reductase
VPTKNDLIIVCKKLNLRPKNILRKGEKDYKENNISNILENDDKILDMMITFPKIIERPIIIIEDKAVIGRPPENILDIL